MISIITVTRNSFRSLQRLRKSLKGASSIAYEWVVVDQASTRAETQEELRAIEDTGEAVVIRNDENFWFTRGINIGLAKAGGDPIVLLNPDCRVSRGWLESMVATLHQRPRRVGIVGPVMINERAQVVHAGALGLGLHEGYLEHYDSEAPWAQTRPIQGWVTGACLMISREAIDVAGGKLDEAYPHFHSDRVLCERVRASGYEIWVSSHVILHSVGGCEQ